MGADTYGVVVHSKSKGVLTCSPGNPAEGAEKFSALQDIDFATDGKTTFSHRFDHCNTRGDKTCTPERNLEIEWDSYSCVPPPEADKAAATKLYERKSAEAAVILRNLTSGVKTMAIREVRFKGDQCPLIMDVRHRLTVGTRNYHVFFNQYLYHVGAEALVTISRGDRINLSVGAIAQGASCCITSSRPISGFVSLYNARTDETFIYGPSATNAIQADLDRQEEKLARRVKNLEGSLNPSERKP